MRHPLLVLALAAVAGPASASSLTSTFTLASDYLFDGVSQTQNDPAFQASLDWAHDSGFYLGTWASNVDFGAGDPANVEIDVYGGFAKEYESGWGWTAGFAHYTYTGAPSSYDYTELTAGVTFPGGTSLQAWASDDDALDGSAWRVKAKHSIDLGDDWSLDFEATRTNYSSPFFTDFTHGQLGVSKAFGNFAAYLGYSTTTLDRNDAAADNGKALAGGRVLFTLSATVDWLNL